MAIQSCYECNKEISSKAIFCPQCGAPQNPVSDLIEHPKVSRLIDKAKEKGGFLRKTFKNLIEYPERKRQEQRDLEIVNALETDIENITREENEKIESNKDRLDKISAMQRLGELPLEGKGRLGKKEKGIRKKAEQSKRENQKTSVDIEDGVEINGNLLWFLALIFFIGCLLIYLKSIV